MLVIIKLVLSFIIFAIDRFRDINDSYGRTKGYIKSKALPAKEFEALLEAQNF